MERKGSEQIGRKEDWDKRWIGGVMREQNAFEDNTMNYEIEMVW